MIPVKTGFPRKAVRRALPAVLLLMLAPRLLPAETIPAGFFAGIRFEEPLPTAFDTGQILPLDGSVDQDGVAWILFRFLPIGRGEQVDFITPVREGRFAREIVFPHSARGQYSLEIFTGKTRESMDYVGRYYGLKMLQGRGPVMLPRRFFPGFLFDQALPTRLATGEPLHLAGEVEDAGAHRALAFSFFSQDGSSWTSFLLVEEGRFERTILVPGEAEGATGLALYAGLREGNLPFVESYLHLEIAPGAEPAEVPPLFFDGLALDEPLPVKWPLRRAVILAGEARPFVRRFWMYLSRLDGGEPRVLPAGLEEGRFRFPLRLTSGEEGPLRLSAVIELQDGTTWEAGEFLIEGVDLPPPDLEVGVVALALLAGSPGKVPLLNRGSGPVALEPPRVEGPFAVEAYPSVLEPGEAGRIELSYDGSGDDQGLLTVLSDDPFRPRVSVALSGLAAREAATELLHLRADASGRIESGFDLLEQDLVFALYAAPAERPWPGKVYDIALDGSAALAKPAASPRAGRRDSVEARARRLERALSLRLRQTGLPAGKPAGVQYEVGDRRSFFFAAQGDVPDQSIEARVVAVNERAVAFVQEDLREDDGNIGEEQLKEGLDLFAEDYPLLVETFGAPSDVDGDGRVAVLVTHLIEDVDVGGQFRASSVLPRRSGGDGNMIDLMWVNPLYPAESLRALLAHEFQHLVNFNQHVLVRRGISEVSWLNEGLSHLAEDLVADHHVSGNYHLVRTFLEEPGAVGLVDGYLVDSPTRGAAYLFVRGLVDLLGEGVLLRLVQTGLVDRDNVEAATGESFADLMARWGAQLYISGTGLSGHSRFNYRISPLQTPQGRGFPPPASVTYRLGEEPPGLAIRPRGVQFLRLEGSEAAALSLQTEPQALLGAVALPVAKAAAAAPMTADHFTGITLDPPLPLQLATGETLLFQGTTADSVEVINLEFVPEDGGEAQRFFLLVREGRFLRTVFFQHDEVSTYSLNVYVDKRQPTPFVGRFFPIRLVQGQDPLFAPTRYFNRVRLDNPLPTSAPANLPFRVSGEVDDGEATLMEFSLFPQGEDGQRSRRAESSQGLPVEAGRFDGELHFDEVPPGTYWLSLDVGQPGDLTYVGAVVNFEVLEPVTAVLEEGETGPQAFALYPNYPNPFNRGTVLSFSLPEAQPEVELTVYDLLGQKLAVLVRGARGSGFHSVAWNGLDDSGRPLASGSYLYRLRAGPHRAVGKLMLLR